jgi:hypothetical protein
MATNNTVRDFVNSHTLRLETAVGQLGKQLSDLAQLSKRLHCDGPSVADRLAASTGFSKSAFDVKGHYLRLIALAAPSKIKV